MTSTHKVHDICTRCRKFLTVRLSVISVISLIKYVGSCITWELHSTGFFFKTLRYSKNYPRWLPTTVTQVQSQVSSYGIGASFFLVLNFPVSMLIPPAVPSPLIVLSSTIHSFDTDKVLKCQTTQKHYPNSLNSKVFNPTLYLIEINFNNILRCISKYVLTSPTP